jgi:hypothetical protein
MSAHQAALTRTTLLLNQEWFAGRADERLIADALVAGTVRLAADAEALSSRAGQTAFVTAFMLTARLGVGIELAAPNVPVIDLVAPLRLPRLLDALLDLGADLTPGARLRLTPGEVQESFAFGKDAVAGDAAVAVGVGDFETDLARGAGGARCEGELPFGGFAAGAAVAAIALRAIQPRVEQAVGLTARTPAPSPGPPVHISLLDLFPELAGGRSYDLGDVDAISGGAITNALLFCLLRIPALTVRVRVIEGQDIELSNVNRYALLRASDTGRHKIDHLVGSAAGNVKIGGVASLYTKDSRAVLLPLAKRVVVGVDDVQARWLVQEDNPAWLAVAATGNNLAQLTSHVPGGPCAGCLHTTPLPPATTPTISFVSFFAGLLQACALASRSSTPRNVHVYPFALGGPAGVMSFKPTRNPDCPIACSSRWSLDQQSHEACS